MRSSKSLLIMVFAILLTAGFSIAPSVAGATEELGKLESADVELVVNFPESPLTDVLDVLSKAGQFEVEYVGEAPEGRVSVVLEPTTVKDVLVYMSEQFGLSFEVPASDKLIVQFPGTGSSEKKDDEK